LIAGFMLDFIQFPVNSKPGLVPETVLFDFGAAYGVVVLMLVFSTWVFWPYALSKRRHEEIVQQLIQRRQQEQNSESLLPEEQGSGVVPVSGS